jgi:acyl carrier protein phosphodiesterase
MNYLAHLFLADDTPESLLGSLLGDFMKGQNILFYSDAIRQGIKRHQQVDTFTDDHPIFRQSKRRIHLERRRFSGVLVDIFYDHFLAIHWTQYSSMPLTQFTQQVYGVLDRHHAILPERLQQAVPAIISQDWLCSYQTLSGIDYALQRMSLRIKRANLLNEGIQDLNTHYSQLELDFKSFLPDLIQYVATL